MRQCPWIMTDVFVVMAGAMNLSIDISRTRADDDDPNFQFIDKTMEETVNARIFRLVDRFSYAVICKYLEYIFGIHHHIYI